MKPQKSPHRILSARKTSKPYLPAGCAALAALALGYMTAATTARANVYATDIQVSGQLTGSYSDAVGTPVSITYHINDPAATSVSITLTGPVTVTIPGTATLGLNTVSWTPTVAGTYSVSILAAASTGYATWQQYSAIDANHGALYAHGGLDVDKNPSSAYYGRVIVGCSTSGTIATTGPANGVVQNDGFYKYNADGTPADEGSYGYAQYTTDDGGNISANNVPTVAGNMVMANGRALAGGANTLGNPVDIQIGEDDRIYWIDDSATGSVQACDIQAIGPAHHILSEAGYATCPDDSILNQSGDGWRRLSILHSDVSSTSSGVAAVFIDDYGDFPNPGSWMWHLTGTAGSMTADPTDTTGTQVVYPGGASDSLRGDGIAVDYGLDIFIGEARGTGSDPAVRTMAFYDWPSVYSAPPGVLPPGGSGFNASETGTANWVEGSGNANEIDVWNVNMNSKSNPTILAIGYYGGLGITLLNQYNPTFSVSGIVNNGNGTITITCACYPLYSSVTPSQLSLYSNGPFTTSPAGPFTTPVTATFAAGSPEGYFTTTISAPSSPTYYQVEWSGPGVTAGTVVSGSSVSTSSAGAPVTSATLENIDSGLIYYSPCFDNVGNLYGASTSDNYWRAWSPPGPNSAVTAAVVTIAAH